MLYFQLFKTKPKYFKTCPARIPHYFELNVIFYINGYPQILRTNRINFVPSQPMMLLAIHRLPMNKVSMGHPGFTLHTVTRFHRPGFHHYYGLICHLTSLRSALDSSLCFSIPQTERNSAKTMQGFPG